MVSIPNLQEYAYRYDFLGKIDSLNTQEIQEKACQIQYYSVFENLMKQVAHAQGVPRSEVSSRGKIVQLAYERQWINQETYDYWRKRVYMRKKKH